MVPRLADFCVVLASRRRRRAAAGGRRASRSCRRADVAETGRGISRQLAAQERAALTWSEPANPKCAATWITARCSEVFERPEDRELLLSFAPTSFIAVPLKTYDRVLGAIVMVNTSEGRMCGTEELALAEELAHRAALAIDNAGLYKAAQKARAESERANLAKDSFLAMLSHELRTPLTPVLTSVLALEQTEALPDEVRASLQMIRRNVELEARLIDDLLDLTRISKGKVQLSLEEVDAHSLLRNALEICQADIDKKQLVAADGVGRGESLPRSRSGALAADFLEPDQERGEIYAAKAAGSKSGPRTTMGNCGWRFPIAEWGSTRKRCRRFSTLSSRATGSQLGGLGLGLAISKALVETHSGKLTAESPGKDQGATFTATFPVGGKQRGGQAERDPVHAGGAEIDAGVARRGPRGHEPVADAAAAAPRLSRASRRTAWSPRWPRPRTSVSMFWSAISGLPDGSGIELMQKLKSDQPIFGIALTGFGMEEDLRRSHDVGFNHHLIKPVDLNRLDALIQQADSVGEEAGRLGRHARDKSA